MSGRAQPPAIRLTYEEATTLLMEALEQPDGARSAFQARIRQLQRIGLLKDTGGKAYARFTYGLVELAILATAFRLMAAFMLPVVAVRHLDERWAEFVPALLSGMGDYGRSRWDQDTPCAGPFVAIEGTALSRLGQKGASDTRYDGPLGAIRCIGASDHVETVWKAAAAQGVLIDTRTYIAPLVAKLAELETVSSRQLADEIDRLRFSGLNRTGNPSG
jgi:hypothetical protein